jgi:Ca2+-binding RTX toxin-like protein
MRRRGTGLLICACAVALAIPSSAGASTIFNGAYRADPGEQNHLTISYDAGAGSYRFEDTGVASIGPNPINGYGGCTVVGNVATCPEGPVGSATKGVSAEMGDGNDSAVITTSLPPPDPSGQGVVQGPRLGGGGGDDLLDSGPGNPYDGSVQRTIDAGLSGDHGLAPIHDGSPDGDDVLIGGVGNDAMTGDGGNDVMRGGGGADWFDGSPFGVGNPAPHQRLAAGADTFEGGEGSDAINGLEPDGAAAADRIDCGSGAEGALIAGFIPGRDYQVPGDVVIVGGVDEVGADCEAVAGVIECPERLDEHCIGTTKVEGLAGPGGAAAAAKKGRRRVVVGSERFKAAPGDLIPVRVALKRKRVNRLLKGRSQATVKQTATARTGKRRIKLGRKRFRIKKA